MKTSLLFAVTFAAMLASDFCVAQTNQSRGVKREKEACEELALEISTNPRASGSGSSTSESIALNIARLQARNELATQLAAEITGILQHRMEQYMITAGAGTAFSASRNDYRGSVTGTDHAPRTLSGVLQRDSMVIAQRVSQILTNTRPICKNTYERSDGSLLVYVCIEMALPEQRTMYSELKQEGILNVDVDGDGKNDIDFSEKEFLIELAKAREEYNAKKAREE